MYGDNSDNSDRKLSTLFRRRYLFAITLEITLIIDIFVFIIIYLLIVIDNNPTFKRCWKRKISAF